MDLSLEKKSQNSGVLASNADIDDLCNRAISGNFEVFDKIVSLYKERLYGVIYNMTFNHEDSADLTQETFVKAFRSLSKFKKKIIFFYLVLSNWCQYDSDPFEKEKAKKIF